MKLNNKELKKAWEDYGHQVAWDDLFDYKFRSDGAYVVLAWKRNGHIECADLYYAGGEWEFANDGGPSLTQGQWDRLKITPECDSYDYPSDEEMLEIDHQERVTRDTKYAAAFEIYREGFDDAYGTDNVVKKWLNSHAYQKFAKKAR